MDTLGIDASPEEIDDMIKEVVFNVYDLNVSDLHNNLFTALILFYQIDASGDGEIDFEEFVAVMSRKVNATYTSDQVKKAFKVFEANNPPGYVRAENLVR